MGELGWEGCGDEEILLSSCGLSPPTPGSPRSTSPAKPPPPPPTNPNPLPCPLRNPKSPPLPSASPSNWAAAHRRPKHTPVDMGRGWRGSSRSSKSGARNPPLWRGMSHLTPCLVNRCMCPTPMVSTRRLYPRLWGGRGGRVWVDHPGEKEMFRVERPLLYASHTAAVTHWEQ